MIELHKTGRYWNWLRTPEGDAAKAVLDVWISDLEGGADVPNVLVLLRAMNEEGFQMNDQSNFLRWLRRSYGHTLIDQAVREQVA